jgi:hypothetical protein
VIDHDHNVTFECQAVVQWSKPAPASRTGVRLLGCGATWQRWVAARWGEA